MLPLGRSRPECHRAWSAGAGRNVPASWGPWHCVVARLAAARPARRSARTGCSTHFSTCPPARILDETLRYIVEAAVDLIDANYGTQLARPCGTVARRSSTSTRRTARGGRACDAAWWTSLPDSGSPGEASRHPTPCAVRRGKPQLSSAARAYGRGNSGGLDRPLLKGPTGNQQQSLALDAPHSLRARSNNYRLVFLEAVVRVPRRRRLTCPGVIPGHFGRLTAQFRSSPSRDSAPPGTDPSSASLEAHSHPPRPARA